MLTGTQQCPKRNIFTTAQMRQIIERIKGRRVLNAVEWAHYVFSPLA